MKKVTRKLIEALQQLDAAGIEYSCNVYVTNEKRIKSDEQARDAMLAMGFGTHKKVNNGVDLFWREAHIEEVGASGHVVVFYRNPPLTCRIVEYTERVPKKLTREEETGEFIEVKRRRVECRPEGFPAPELSAGSEAMTHEAKTE